MTRWFGQAVDRVIVAVVGQEEADGTAADVFDVVSGMQMGVA